MCGIAGFIQSGIQGSEFTRRIRRMTDTLIHRGPDDEGSWGDITQGVMLGHRRLSILDLSPEGRQPMHSPSGRYVIVFNGEIYNYSDLRSSLMGEIRNLTFRGRSDTEILLAAFDHWGVEATLKKTNGMFAFGLWDKEHRALILARDRLGKKPLYYGWAGKVFLFASELKALRAHPSFRPEIDRDALALYLRYACVPQPHSIYAGIQKLTPGTFLSIKPHEVGVMPSPQPYWSAQAMVESAVLNPFRGSEEESLDHLETLLRDAVNIRMVADVPLGAFLSGGVDSSAVVGLMQAQSSRPVKTFTIGFHEGGYNEAQHAKEVARHLGTEHTELYVTPDQAREVIPLLPVLYDEPFADASQIPTYLVAQLARQYVTVALSGDGGDEVFGGYTRYFMGESIWKKIQRIPFPLRKGLGRLLRTPTPHHWERLAGLLSPFMKAYGKQGTFGDKFSKLASVLDMPDADAFYHRLVSAWDDPAGALIKGRELEAPFLNNRRSLTVTDTASRMMFYDLIGYLPDDILVKVDRASMGVSLEARAPFLDYRVAEFAWRLPLSMKIQGGRGKQPLRKILDKYVPRKLIDRPKMGFGVPIDSWLRGPLKAWAEALLEPGRVRREGFFHAETIERTWRDHLSGRRNAQYPLWCILMFQSWLEHTKD